MNLGALVVIGALITVASFVSVFVLRASIAIFNSFLGKVPEEEPETAIEHGFQGVIRNEGPVVEPSVLAGFGFFLVVNLILHVLWFTAMPAMNTALDVRSMTRGQYLMVWCGIGSINTLVISCLLAPFLNTSYLRAFTISIIQVVLSVTIGLALGFVTFLVMWAAS